MPLLSEADQESVKRMLGILTGPVKLINFTQELECQFCRETNQIIREIAELSDKIKVETYNFIIDKEAVDKYKVDKIPATIVMGEEDRGIRFYGMPSGFEIISLLEDIKVVSSGESGLSEKTKDILKKLKDPLHIQVLVTPT
jgi:glutaredoxin-like protein